MKTGSLEWSIGANGLKVNVKRMKMMMSSENVTETFPCLVLESV